MVIHENIKRKAISFEGQQSALRKKADAEGIDPAVKAATITDIEARGQSYKEMLEEWALYVKEVGDFQGQMSTVLQQLPTLRLIRDNASVQLELLETWAVLQVVKGNLGALQATSLTLQEMKMVTLTPGRLSRLFKI
jgi:hypothetical protein